MVAFRILLFSVATVLFELRGMTLVTCDHSDEIGTFLERRRSPKADEHFAAKLLLEFTLRQSFGHITHVSVSVSKKWKRV